MTTGNPSFPPGRNASRASGRGPAFRFTRTSPPQFRGDLAAWESGDAAALSAILGAARPRDALTLWHLLTRVPESARGRVFDRFAQLVTVPSEVTRTAVLRRDRHALDLCWDALNLENTGWWRGWERPWK